jgi:uroporphyrinogen decarboxylase
MRDLLDSAVFDRIMKAASFEEPDRVPIWDYLDNRAVLDHFAPGEMAEPRLVGAAMAAEVLAKDLLQANMKTYHGLGIDLCRGFGSSFSDEDEGQDIVNEQGTLQRRISGRTSWLVQRPIASLEEIGKFEAPPVSEEWVREVWAAEIRNLQEAFAPHTMYVPGHACGFHATYDLMGLQLFSYAIHDAADDLGRLLQRQGENSALIARVAAELKLCPLFFIGDDIAYKNKLMFSPSLLRRTFIPMLEAMCRPLNAAGIKVIYHSDGDLTPIVDDLVEAGVDGLNPIEPIAGMDIGFLKRKYRGRLILVGNVDCSQVLPLGTPEDIERAVKECLRAAAPGGGHFIGSSSEVTPSTPLENVLAFYGAIHEWGTYPIRC